MISRISNLLFAESMSVEQLAQALRIQNFNATVRGEFKLVAGTNSSGYITSALSSPVEVLRDLKGVQTLKDAGFSDPDIALALGIDRLRLKKVYNEARKSNKKPVAPAPVQRTSKAISLDDL
ncbi:hypothetical protein pEaSNUABM25_00286 [Erwinia phage pEa_SNUABM_25]|nr:hypothetical protein pEaSNUABM25_00286 [Erwinia phage pEa_SNUABM_25]